MKITWSGFKGENRALQPLLVADSQSTLSLNQNPVRGDMRPWGAPLTVATVPPGRNTIYRMGRDVASDTLYWLSWPGVVYAVRGFNPDDTTERTYYTGDGVPKWTDNTIALASAPYPTTFRTLGVPAPVSQLILTASGGVSTIIETRYYVYTFVSDKGEESSNSPVSLVLKCKIDDAVAISNIATPPAGSYTVNRIRIYRTQTTASSGAPFLFRREVAAGLTSTTDDNRDINAEPLPSAGWLPPPADLSNLTGMWNGMMAGISGNAVRVCEAFKPYAWPIAYDILPPDSKPVALKVFGQALLVLTTGRPRLVTGGTPDALDDQPVEWVEACVSARSAVSFGHGVAWACPDGLAYFGSGGPKMITQGLMTREDWQAIKPETIVGSMYEGAYLGEYTVAGVTKGFVVDPMNPSGMFFTDIPASAFFFDEYQDQLYLLDGVNIKKWNYGAALTATARSKLFRTPKPVNFGCFQVTADAYPVNVKVDCLNMDPLEVTRLAVINPRLTVLTTKSLRFEVNVPNSLAQRLPAGFTADQWQIQVSSTGAVQGVAMAQSIKELAEI
ncbi:MAG: hypothetical protein H7293_03280 [Candidatus Saccharibacteria bacterium]|nr:hypothetical protein [Rhodoferax sp.]